LRSRAAALALVLAASLSLAAEPASGQESIFGGMQKSIDTVFSSVSMTTTSASGEVTKTETTSIAPSLYLNLDTLVYPQLRLNAGGVWEINLLSTASDGFNLDSTITRSRPFFLLRSTNPVLSPGIGYNRREDRARTAGFSDIKLVNDEAAAYLGWNPAGGPTSEFQFVRTHTFDGERALQDITRDYGSLVSNYTLENFSANYNGGYLVTNDQIAGLETRQTSHAGRVSYAGSFIQKRLLWNASYNINYLDLTTVATGQGGDVDLPLSPISGLASLSDTPATSSLTQNALLIDGNLTAGAGIDLGAPTPLEDPQSRNIGLDFLNPVDVNRLLVWVDRDLPIAIANSFSWEIYSSPDNVVWRREASVSSAPFGPFEFRFEVEFPRVNARYVKVVVRPLSVAVPEASRFPDILVTEVQAFLRMPAEEASERLTQTTHVVNTDVRFRILDAPALFYEGFYLYNGPNAFGRSTDTLSNGLSVDHAFARVFSAFARVAREQGTRTEGYVVGNVANASLTVEPVRTFRSSLLYNGRDERTDLGDHDRRSIQVQNSAQLYTGVDVLFGFGWNFTTVETGEEWHDRFLNLSGTVVPREHVSLTFSYDAISTRRSGTFVGAPESDTQRFYVAIAFDPTRTLHLAFGEEVWAASDQKTRTTFNASANWAPFPDGAVQFVFAYNEALRDLVFGSDRNTLGGIRWNLTRRSYIDVSYQFLKSESVSYSSKGKTLSATVKLFF